MNNSGGFQTGGIVLLAMSIVFCGITVSLVIPLLDKANQPMMVEHTVVMPSESSVLAPVSSVYSEFYTGQEVQPQIASGSLAATRPHPPASRTEQASYAQTVSQPTTASSQFQRPAMPPEVNSTQFYTAPRPTAATGSSANAQAESPRPQSANIWNNSQITANKLAVEPVIAEAQQVAGPSPSVIVDNSPVATSGSEPPKFAPAQIPSGSVYAPVTVNLDTSVFSEQIRSLERRLDEAASARPQASQPPTFQQPIVQQPIIQPIIQQPVTPPVAERPRRDRVARNDARRRDDRDEDLSRIGDGLKELVTSFKELQHQTSESLREVSRQAERREDAAEVIEAYRMALLRDARQAAQVRVPERAPERRIQERIAEPFPKPTRVATRTVASDVQRFESPRALAQKAATVSSPPTLKHFEEPKIEEPPVVEEMPIMLFPEETTTTISAASVPVTIVDKTTMTARILPPKAEVQSVPLKTSQPKLVPVEAPPEIEGFLPIPLPLDANSTSLSPVPDTPRQIAPVGYANTYRFKMAVADSGVAKVVPADDVCPQCGKAHGPNEPHAEQTSQIVQTAAVESPPKTPNKTSLRRDTRNAGRGMNRKIGSRHSTAASAESGKSSKPFLKLKLPTLTKGADEPGILHRMSSTIKQLGRSVQ